MKYFSSKSHIKTWSLWLSTLSIFFIALLYKGKPANEIGFILLIIGIILIYLIIAYHWKYPEVTGSNLVIRNALYIFYKMNYNYRDIEKVEICRGSIYHWPCVKIYTTKRNRPYFHCLDCMSQDSIQAFLNELNSHGVKATCTVSGK